jgi:type IV pilus assembly protein PilW
MSYARELSRLRYGAGLTLVELLIALVMGLVLLAGVVTVFVANKQTYRHQDALARLQENGRFAINRMERDIRRAAGSGSCAPANPINTVQFDGGSCPSNQLTPLGSDAIYGIDNVATTKSFGSGASAKTVKLGTDFLQLLIGIGGNCNIIRDIRPSAQMKVGATCQVADGDIVLVVSDLNCTRGAVFQITNTNIDIENPNPKKRQYEVIHNPGQGNNPVVQPGNCKGPEGKEIGAPFDGGFLVKIGYANYFVADTGRGVPALYVAETTSGNVPQELVEGVEDMQLLFGVGDPAPERMVEDYLTAQEVDAAAAWGRVRSIRVHLLLQSVDANALTRSNPIAETSFADFQNWRDTPNYKVDYGDRRWRQTYSATIGVRNRLP